MLTDLIKTFYTSLPEGDMTGLKIKDIGWAVKTAGPSPFNNERTELFLLGCNRAKMGYPCKGCFNPTTWNDSKAELSHDPVLVAKHINNIAPNKYITIGGGEPLDQIDNLIVLCEELKKYGFHIIVYTWRRIEVAMNVPKIARRDEKTNKPLLVLEHIGKEKIEKLLTNIDILIDGEYKENERLYNYEAEDGLTNSIGSGNQGIIVTKTMEKVLMKNIKSLKLSVDNNFIIERIDKI